MTANSNVSFRDWHVGRGRSPRSW